VRGELTISSFVSSSVDGGRNCKDFKHRRRFEGEATALEESKKN